MVTPTPQLVQTVIETGLLENAFPFIASVWAVLILFVFVMLVSRQVRDQNAFLIIAILSLPVILVNAGWFAVSVYVFVLLYMLVSRFMHLV